MGNQSSQSLAEEPHTVPRPQLCIVHRCASRLVICSHVLAHSRYVPFLWMIFNAAWRETKSESSKPAKYPLIKPGRAEGHSELRTEL